MTEQQRAAAGPEPSPGTGPDHDVSASGPAPGGPGAETSRTFRRDAEQKMLGGVCAGLGRHCDMDPVIFRIVLAVLSVTGGMGLIFYGFAWLFVPYLGERENEGHKLLSGRVDGPALTAVVFALVGCGLFLSMLNNGGVLTFGAMVALLLAGAGYWSRQRGALDPDPLTAQAAADAPPEAKAPPAPAAAPSWWRDPIVKDGRHVGGTGYLWGPKETRDRMAALNIARWSRWDGETSGSHRPPAAPSPRWIGGWVFLLALVAGGLGTGLTWDTQPLGTSLQTGLACALGVLGLGITVSAVLGRTGAGSIVLAVITAALLAGASVLPANITTEWIREDWTPVTAEQVRPRYELGTGMGTLDLSGVAVAGGKTLTTRAEVGAGRLRVVVPKEATVRLHVEVGLGDIQLPQDAQQDVDIAPGKEKNVTLIPPGGGDGGMLDLNLEVGVGQAEVLRAAS